jgi:hypothetical protein
VTGFNYGIGSGLAVRKLINKALSCRRINHDTKGEGSRNGENSKGYPFSGEIS